jgi:hypothetical protein
MDNKEHKQKCKDCNTSLEDCTCIEDTIDMKEETLEEFIKSIYPSPSGAKIKGIELGVKWQQKNSYSEEEVIELIEKAIEDKWANLRYWFEQFKKK